MLKVQIDIHHNTVLFVQKNSVNDTSLIFKKKLSLNVFTGRATMSIKNKPEMTSTDNLSLSKLYM